MALLGITHRSRESRGGSPGWARGWVDRWTDRHTETDRRKEEMSVSNGKLSAQKETEGALLAPPWKLRGTDEERSELGWA